MGRGHAGRGGGRGGGGRFVDNVAVDVPPGVDADLPHQLLVACNKYSFSCLTNYLLTVAPPHYNTRGETTLVVV